MRGSDERLKDLDRLLENAKAELRDWTEFQSHDPGITLLQLFAFLGETLSSYADQIADEAHLSRRRPTRDIRVEVEGKRWLQVASLDESGPDDAHYLASVGEDGATVLEFGDGEHGRRPPEGGRLRVSLRRAGRYVSVEMQQGRVILDADWNAPTAPDVCGIYRAAVVSATDPMSKGRLLVQIPVVTGIQNQWAMPCWPPGAAELPTAGDSVWVLFEACDVERPVWLGRLTLGP